MRQNNARPGWSRLMLRSWLGGLLCLSLPIGFVGLVCWRQMAGLDPTRCLQLGLIFLCGYTVLWMLFGKVLLAEGEFFFAEYGGADNLLQRIHFRDGRVWTFSRPVNIGLWSGPKPGCILQVAVCENFFGQVHILYRMFNCYNGENEWFDEDL